MTLSCLTMTAMALPVLAYTPPETGIGGVLTESLWGPAFDFSQVGALSVTGLILFVAGILASAAGIGGGGIYVAVLMFGLGLDPHVAVPLSKAIIFGGAVMSYRKNRSRLNPETQLPLIDIELVKNIVPSALAGTLFGVFLNLKFSPLLLVVCLSTLLTAMSVKTFAKAISMYREENGNMGVGNDRREPLLRDQGAGVRSPTAQRALIDEDKKERFSAYYSRDMGFLFLLLAVVVYFGVSRHQIEESFAVMGDPEGNYSMKHSMMLLIPVAIALALQILFRSSVLPTARATLNPNSDPPSVYFPLVSFFAGICSGLFGIGGGLIFSPFLLHMGIDGQVTTVTSATCVIFTATSTTAQYLLMGRIILPLAFAYGAVSSLASSVGTTLPATMERRFGRKSAVVFIVAFAVAISACLTIAKSVVISAPEIYLAAHPSPQTAMTTPVFIAGGPKDPVVVPSQEPDGHEVYNDPRPGYSPQVGASSVQPAVRYATVTAAMPAKSHHHQHDHHHTITTAQEIEKEMHEENGELGDPKEAKDVKPPKLEEGEGNTESSVDKRTPGHHGAEHHSHHGHHTVDEAEDIVAAWSGIDAKDPKDPKDAQMEMNLITEGVVPALSSALAAMGHSLQREDPSRISVNTDTGPSKSNATVVHPPTPAKMPLEHEAPNSLQGEAPTSVRNLHEEAPNSYRSFWRVGGGIPDESPTSIHASSALPNQEAPSSVSPEAPGSLKSEGPHSLRNEGPHSLRHEGPSSLGQESPSSLGQESPSSLGQESPSSLRNEGPHSLRNEGPHSLRHEGPHSLRHEGPSSLEPESPTSVASPESEPDYRKDPTDMAHARTPAAIKSPHAAEKDVDPARAHVAVAGGDIDHIPDPELTSALPKPRALASAIVSPHAAEHDVDLPAFSLAQRASTPTGDVDHIPDPEVRSQLPVAAAALPVVHSQTDADDRVRPAALAIVSPTAAEKDIDLPLGRLRSALPTGDVDHIPDPNVRGVVLARARGEDDHSLPIAGAPPSMPTPEIELPPKRELGPKPPKAPSSWW